MKPPQQPHARKSGEILQGRFVTAVRQQLQNVALRFNFRRLVQRLKLHLLPGADEADGFKRERVIQAFIPSIDCEVKNGGGGGN